MRNRRPLNRPPSPSLFEAIMFTACGALGALYVLRLLGRF